MFSSFSSFFASVDSLGFVALLTSKNDDPTMISEMSKNATVKFGKSPRLSPIVKTTMAIPMMTIIQLPIAAVECSANSFFPESVTR